MMSEYIIYKHICTVCCSRTQFYNTDVELFVLLHLCEDSLLLVAL